MQAVSGWRLVEGPKLQVAEFDNAAHHIDRQHKQLEPSFSLSRLTFLCAWGWTKDPRGDGSGPTLAVLYVHQIPWSSSFHLFCSCTTIGLKRWILFLTDAQVLRFRSSWYLAGVSTSFPWNKPAGIHSHGIIYRSHINPPYRLTINNVVALTKPIRASSLPQTTWRGGSLRGPSKCWCSWGYVTSTHAACQLATTWGFYIEYCMYNEHGLIEHSPCDGSCEILE